jgi:hypothetical protein
MRPNGNRPPAGVPWVWLTRDLLRSDAWRTASINARRAIEFLLLEHMAKGGKHNGKLKAPYRQLVAFGVGSRLIADHLREAEELGLIDCFKGGMRVATQYAIGWLPLHDGTPAADRWREYHNPELAPMPTRQPKNLPAKGSADKSGNLPAKSSAGLPAESSADDQNLPAKSSADTPLNLPAESSALLRKVLPGEAGISEETAAEGDAAVLPFPWNASRGVA